VVVIALIVAAIDEFRRPPSNIRRMGAGLALVAGFAGIWLAVTPTRAGTYCEPPVFVVGEYLTPPEPVTPGCLEAMRWNAILALGLTAAAPLAVLATRSRRD
jgi:aconitase B